MPMERCLQLEDSSSNQLRAEWNTSLILAERSSISRLKIFADLPVMRKSDTTDFQFKLCNVCQRSDVQARIVPRYRQSQRLRHTAVTDADDDGITHCWALSSSDRYKCRRIYIVHNVRP